MIPVDKTISATSHSRPLVQGRGICKAFGGQMVLNGIDFDLDQGEVVLLRGANGSGKTTLLNLLTGNLVPDKGRIDVKINGNEEHFAFPRHWWQHLNPVDHFLPERVAREGIGRSWQDTRLFHSIHLIENITVATEKHPGENPLNVFFRPRLVKQAETISRSNAQIRLEELGLGDRTTSSGDKVSLGQSKRVAIARAIAGGAKVLFLDEPLSGLDAPGIKSVVEMLRELVREHRVTLVIIEHVWNARHILPIADTLWTLDRGKLSQEKNSQSSNLTVDCSEQGGFGSIAPLFPEYGHTQSLDLPRGARLDVYRKTSTDSGEPVLDIQNLVVHRGKRLVIGKNDHSTDDAKGLSFNLKSGDLAVLSAPNGWGKTTLLDAIAGTAQITTGSFCLCGRDVAREPVWTRSRLGLRYFRSDNDGFPSLRVNDVLKMVSINTDKDIDAPSHLRYGELSGGQKRRTMLRLIDDDQLRLAILDEPFAAFDAQAITEATNYVTKSLATGRNAVLIATPKHT